MIKVTVSKNTIDSVSEEEIDKKTSELIEYFQRHMGGSKQSDMMPYRHQYNAFIKIMNNEEIMLTAGTSSGKTLAHAIPLFYKIKKGLVDKILFLYPTRALLQDQKTEMIELAKIYGLTDEISEIKGGISRSEIIRAINKKIIIATPDSIYWFFNKNIKYSSFLIYGLAQIDEVVIDEAHLFTGLVLNNLIFLIQRMKKLSELINKEQRYHILTATANDFLKDIHGKNIDEMSGKSNCGNINLEIINKDKNNKFIGELYTNSLQKEVINTENKISCVGILNSAKVAHQLFYSNTQEIDVKELNKDDMSQFNLESIKMSVQSLLKNIKQEEQKKEIEEILKKKKNISKICENISLKEYLKKKTRFN